MLSDSLHGQSRGPGDAASADRYRCFVDERGDIGDTLAHAFPDGVRLLDGLAQRYATQRYATQHCASDGAWHGRTDADTEPAGAYC